ncbi:hypothetical protein TNCV_3728631 [Trichonephila clavipes]|nr:hypothetical protein TNCV_3728631 [Trichonephila clavipes]
MNEDHTNKKAFNAQPIGTQRKGRPNLRWIDGLEKDLQQEESFFKRPRPIIGCRGTDEGRNDWDELWIHVVIQTS